MIAEELRLAVRLATCGAVGVTGSLSVPGRSLKTGDALNNTILRYAPYVWLSNSAVQPFVWPY